MMSEWWASEIIIFLSGSLLSNPEAQVAATSITQTLNSLCFMLPSGFNVAASTRVGNLLGANDSFAAQISCKTSTCLALIVSLLSSFLILIFRTNLGLLFTNNQEVLYILDYTLLTLALYVIADGVQTALTGALKGIGRQSFGAPIVLFSYYAVGIPSASVLAFPFGLNLGAVRQLFFFLTYFLSFFLSFFFIILFRVLRLPLLLFQCFAFTTVGRAYSGDYDRDLVSYESLPLSSSVLYRLACRGRSCAYSSHGASC